MKINVNRCYFHSIQPLINYKINKNLCAYSKKEVLDATIKRLETMLEYGYLVPGKDLENILPEEYKKNAPIPIYGDDSVYLAQTFHTELPSIGGSYFDGEFSAYSWHISNSHALVFSEKVTENKRIEIRNHSLSEEICIQEKVSLEDLIAIQLPYDTPLKNVKQFISHCEEDAYAFNKIFFFITQRLAEKAKKSLEDPNAIEKIYSDVQLFSNCIKKYKKDIPCIHQDGSLYDQQQEYEYLEANREKTLKLIKKVEEVNMLT